MNGLRYLPQHWHLHDSIGQRPPCKQFTAALLLHLSLASPLMAQVIDYGAYEELFEEPVTASVTGSPQRASDVPASMEIISAEIIRRSGARDIPGVLSQVTGMNVTRWANNSPEVSDRGYNTVFNPRVLVMINGRQVYSDHYGYVPWNTLPVVLEEIRQIEVVKGPNSALFGFNAAGGVINIITFNPLYDDVSVVSLRAGTQQLVQGSIVGTFSLGEKGGIRLSVNGMESDDFDTPQIPIDTGSRLGDNKKTIGITLGYRLTENVELAIEGTYSNSDHTSMGPSYNMLFQNDERKSIRGRLSADTSYGLVELDAYQNRLDEKAFVPGSRPVIQDGRLMFNNRVTVFKLQDIFKVGAAHTFRLSGEYRESDLNTTPISGAEVSYDVKSISAMWNWQINQSLSYSAAIRHDRLALQRKGLIPPGLYFSNADWDRHLHEVSYNTGLVWNISEQDTLRLTAASGKQLPSLYSFGGTLIGIPVPPQIAPSGFLYITGVPTVSPSTVDNYELAWERSFPTSGLTLKAAVFGGKTKDTTSFGGDSYPARGVTNAPANLGDSEASGFEFSLTGSHGENWRWSLGYVYEQIDDDFGAAYPPGVTLKSFEYTTPEHIVSASLGWKRGPWTVDGYLRYESSTLNFRPPEDFANPQNVLFPVSDFTVMDARISYRLNNNTSIDLAGNNLLHDNQIQHTGPAVERSVFLGLTVEF